MRRGGWRPTRKLAKQYRDQNTCMCSSCVKAFADRGEALARLKAQLKRGLARETTRKVGT